MQGQNQVRRKHKVLMELLVAKISRLRKRLVTCGYSIKQVAEIIFMQFLKLPKIDWKNLDETNNLYEVKSAFKVDSNSAQIIMRLQKIVPDLHTFEVCQYLLTVLELNASDYGFNLEESSSDSNDSNSGMHRFIARRPRKRVQTVDKKQESCEKTWKDDNFKVKNSKKLHFDNEYYENKKKKEQVDEFFRSHEVNQILLPFQDEQLQKEMKKMPESEDSDNQ